MPQITHTRSMAEYQFSEKSNPVDLYWLVKLTLPEFSLAKDSIIATLSFQKITIFIIKTFL